MMAEFTPSDEAREALARWMDHEGFGYWVNVDQITAEAIAAGWVPAAEYRDHRITELEAALAVRTEQREDLFEKAWKHLDERDAALAVIEKAPHAEDCDLRYDFGDGLVHTFEGSKHSTRRIEGCTCWKSTADTSALAARDAEKWDEGFDAGERDAFDLEEHPDHECIANPYRALAEKGADR